MRLVPLIPLALLGVGTFVVDYLTPTLADGPQRSFAASFADASVAGSTPQLRTQFRAEAIDLGELEVEARAVSGLLDLAYGEHAFRASQLQLDAATGAIEMRGNVGMWRDDQRFDTEYAHLDPDGGINGSAVEFAAGRSSGQAAQFALTPAGALQLSGGLRALVRGE